MWLMGKPAPFPLIMTHIVIRMKVQIAKVSVKMMSGSRVWSVNGGAADMNDWKLLGR